MIGKKKKLIVPVVAIMMCAVALAGVAYALTTSVSNTEVDPDSEYKVLVFSELNGTEITSGSVIDDAASNGFTITTDTTINVPKVVAKIDGEATIVAYFKMASDADTANYTVAGTASLSTTSVTITQAAADHKVITLAASAVSVTNTDGSAIQGNLVKGTVYMASFTITATTPAADQVQNAGIWFNDATAITDAGYIVAALNNVTFTLSLTATLA